MIQAILFDLDSTLANTEHRAHLLGGKSHESWIDYSKACTDDAPIMGPVTALRLFHDQGFLIHLVSGRNEEAREETVDWLIRHGIPFDSLRLRRADDIRHNGKYKVAYIDTLRSYGIEPVLFFEDHLTVAQMIEEAGVPCVTVRPWYVDSVGPAINGLRPSQA